MARVRSVIAAAREAEAWEMRQRGMRQSTIAAKLGISDQSVSTMLKKALAKWRALNQATTGDHIEAMLAQVDTAIERLEALFEASKSPQRKQRMRRAGKDPSQPDLVELSTEERIGDTQIMLAILRHQEFRAKLLGLYAPTKVAPTDPTGQREYAGDVALSDAERARRVAALMAAGAKD